MRKTIIALVMFMGLGLFVGNTADAAKNSRSCVCQVGGDFHGNLNCTVTGSANGKLNCHVSKGGGDGEGKGKGKCKDDEDCKGGEKDKDDDDAEESNKDNFAPAQFDPFNK